MREITYRQAVNEALAEEMERDPNVFLMDAKAKQIGVDSVTFAEQSPEPPLDALYNHTFVNTVNGQPVSN